MKNKKQMDLESLSKDGNNRRKFFIKLAKRLSFSKEKMARYAFNNTPFYRQLYKDHMPGFKGDFQDLPIVLKSEINKASPFDLLSESLKDDVFKYAETTGSTGSPTPSFFTKSEFAGSIKLSKLSPLLAYLNESKKENRKAVCGLACGFTIAGSSFQQILEYYGFLTVNVDARTTIAPPERVARLLVRYKPSVIAAAETDFLAWMKIVKEDYPDDYGDVVSNLKGLLSTAELCSENRSRQISEEFEILHVDNYACVEGYFSVPCTCGEKHVLPVYHAEVLSDDLKTSSEYGSGRFAFTNLLRKSTPLVRYLLDDYISITQSECPYGFTKSIQPHGRYELSVLINNKRFGTRHFENILFKNSIFGEYRIRIHEDKIDITAELYNQRKINTSDIIKDFENFFGMPADIVLVPYGELRNYREIRTSKPLARVQDLRVCSTQEMPQYV